MEKEIKFLVYRSADENISVNAIVRDESIWLTQKAMGDLFGIQTPAISKHLKNIFEEGELDEKVVCAKIALTTQHGAMADKTQTKETQPSTPFRRAFRYNPVRMPCGVKILGTSSPYLSALHGAPHIYLRAPSRAW